jgi:hypothetical protein
MKTCGGLEVQLQAFLTSALDEDELSVSSFASFITGERAPFTH